MNEYQMPHRNSCFICGAILQTGDPVFAENFDQVRSGRGMCKVCAFPPSESSTVGIAPKTVAVKSRRKVK